jgi:hypothetical protein
MNTNDRKKVILNTQIQQKWFMENDEYGQVSVSQGLM